MHTIMQSNPMPAALLAWRDAELDYCRSLVFTGATREVPDNSIASYLRVQKVYARRDAREDVRDYLTALLSAWRRSPRYCALRVYDRY